MKKPFISLSKPFDIAKCVLCVLLCASVLSLFFRPDESAAVFADGNGDGRGSLFGLVSGLM